MVDEIALNLTLTTPPEAAQRLIDAAAKRAKGIDWFDFVASNHAVVYTLLSALQRGRFCEWGSGMGVVTGLAEMLGFEAAGVEIHEPLVTASRELLAEFGLRARIELGDFLERDDQADLYFSYEWPGRLTAVVEHFQRIAPPGARLLIYYGPADIRWVAKE